MHVSFVMTKRLVIFINVGGQVCKVSILIDFLSIFFTKEMLYFGEHFIVLQVNDFAFRLQTNPDFLQPEFANY